MTTAEVIALAHKAMHEWKDSTFLNPLAAMPDNSGSNVEWHPLVPFIPSNARILFLGSFPPPQKRWAMPFFYPNYINDHWRIHGVVFRNNANAFVDTDNKSFKLEEIITHLHHCGIAYYDAALAIRRLAENASDKFLEVVEPTDIPLLASQLPQLRAIVTTGEKATATVLSLLADNASQASCAVGSHIYIPKLHIELYRLPSSSRAYPLSLLKKAEAYVQMFERYL